MKSWQRYAALVLLGTAGVVIYQSLYVLRLTDAGQPGSGFMPFGLGIILAGLATLLLLVNVGRDPTRHPFFGAAWLRPLMALALMGAFAYSFNWLGAVLSVVLLVCIWLLLIERKRVLVAVGSGLATGLVVYVLFEVLLQAPFPAGTLFGG